MGYFSDYLKRTDDRMLSKWVHYFEVYEREMTRFRQRPISFLEIGVFKGGSIPMWKGFFAEGSRLTFVDIDPDCAQHAEEGTSVEIGNQADPDFLAQLAEKHGPFDVILDDGSHVCAHQIASFEALWPHISDRGIYVVEDCHTSYWPGFGGGYRNEASWIEYAKRLVDRMHSWYTDQDAMFPFDEIAKDLQGVRFYDSITVAEKHQKPEPPTTLYAQNGKVTLSRRALAVRGRKSAFAGKDGT
ncbi:class I SAM-dependent methyltransferase [Roseibacterium beibuensis]|uniref:Methyltransferase domain-containing protein n=1 Tax=[Roseibacterium] beibuensis TaxID=1193142 RepID=A0ABP9LAL1_9RHOB|nr:class I SAM-dependent methyltransferase [Roseibacterium beibuensis]MCS6626626.1 class I SAM-dependent methyltransferase [Roseibacterium beibuensis]